MKKFLLIVTSVFLIQGANGFAQSLNLKNVVVVAQQDKLKDQYTLELAIVELMRDNNVNAIASLNIVPDGRDPVVLATDSLQRNLLNKGFDTYMLVSVRGYDKRFNPPENLVNMKEELSAGHLFQLWRESASTVTFTVIFYRNNVPAHSELIRVRARGSKDKMMKGFTRKMERRLKKGWI